MTAHVLKTDGDCWEEVHVGNKPFEIRKDDREPRFEPEDIVVLVHSGPGPRYGMRAVRRIGYVYRGEHAPAGFCVFSLEKARNGDLERIDGALDVVVSK